MAVLCYRTDFKTRAGSRRRVVGLLAFPLTLEVREEEYNLRGEACPAFARCAAGRVTLRELEGTRVGSLAAGLLLGLVWFGWLARDFGGDWRSGVRGPTMADPRH